MSSKQSTVMGEVTNTINFVVDYTKANVIDHANLKEYGLTQEQLQGLCSVIENSVNDAYHRSMNQIIKAIDHID